MRIKESETYWVWIYLSGDIDVIKQLCRGFVMRGLCVTVQLSVLVMDSELTQWSSTREDNY